jgi:hypothetical protein
MSFVSKPWLELSPNKGNWWISSINLRPTLKNNKKDILCYYIIQDCNMSGEYYRVFTWYKYDNNRYFEIKRPHNWDFKEDFINFNNNDVLLNKYNNKYKVFVKHECVKILELVE